MATKKTAKKIAKKATKKSAKKATKNTFERLLSCLRPEQVPAVMKAVGQMMEGRVVDSEEFLALVRSIDRDQLDLFARRLSKRDYKVFIIIYNAVLDLAEALGK